MAVLKPQPMLHHLSNKQTSQLFSARTLDPSGVIITPINNGANYFLTHQPSLKKLVELLQYGLNDITCSPDSIKYLEQMQQPFYVKCSTVVTTFTLYFSQAMKERKGTRFPLLKTKEPETVSFRDHFAAANYVTSNQGASLITLRTGLYDNSIIVMYGDYAVSLIHANAILPNFSVRT